MDNQIRNFWYEFKRKLPIIKPLIFNNDQESLVLTKQLLGDLNRYVDINFTYGMINSRFVKEFRDHIELYISPKFNKDNDNVMLLIYNTYNKLPFKLPNILVNCYNNFYKEEPFETLTLTNNGVLINADGESTVKYLDFGVQTNYSMDKNGKALLNLIICINENVADLVIEKKNVSFNKSSNRDVYLPKNGLVTTLLNNIVGEFNMIKNIGYIEFMNSKDADEVSFDELSYIRKELELIYKQRNYKNCKYCNKSELQSILTYYPVGGNYYCNELCSKLDDYPT